MEVKRTILVYLDAHFLSTGSTVRPINAWNIVPTVFDRLQPISVTLNWKIEEEHRAANNRSFASTLRKHHLPFYFITTEDNEDR